MSDSGKKEREGEKKSNLESEEELEGVHLEDEL